MALTKKQQENVQVRENILVRRIVGFKRADKRTIACLPYCRDVIVGVSSRQYGRSAASSSFRATSDFKMATSVT